MIKKLSTFADVVISVLDSSEEDIEALHAHLLWSRQGNKCIYLGEAGCPWKVKPLVCTMFLCDKAELWCSRQIQSCSSDGSS